MKHQFNIACTFFLALGLLTMACACSSTSALSDGEQLYTGMKATRYTNYEKNPHFTATRQELDVVLATRPNASLFGSSSWRSPFPVGLWIWNAFSPGQDALSKFLVKAFGSKPVLMTNANPDLHVTVGNNLLRKRGYFNGKINYEIITSHNPKKAKLAYTVNMGHLWTLDTVRYVNFPAEADTLIQLSRSKAGVKQGDAFDVTALENERQRLATLFRDNGYYYYTKDNASFLADTVSRPGKVMLSLQMADSVENRMMKKYYVGNITINFRKQLFEQLSQSRHFRSFTVNYNGRKMPLRLGVILAGMKLKPGSLYSYDNEQQLQSKITATGLFSNSSLTWTPRDSTQGCDTLDLTVDCTFDKPYDFYVEAYGKGKTSGKYGPELIVGLTKRNAFRGGELLSFKAHGSYEWASGRSGNNTSSHISSYEYGAEASIEMPRIFNPFRRSMRKLIERAQSKASSRQAPRLRQLFYDTPTTTLKASSDVINRADFFKRHVVSGELTYNWMTSAQSSYFFSPLILTYEYMQSRTDSFIHMEERMPYLQTSMADQFVPKMSFTYTYHSPSSYHHPISWTSTVSEASNLLSLGYMAFGRKWGEKNKEMFKNPFAQFVKIETDYVKQWGLTPKSSIVAHVGGGVLWSYGNSVAAPYTEQFYVGGANSIRAFNVREIGPGKYRSENELMAYVEQTGDIKFQANLEYRPHLFGSLYGAVFLDAGNVWTMHDDEHRPNSRFYFKNALSQLAVGTGVGLRYDLGYFVVRLDWGVGLHVPYDTTRSGFYNIDNFHDAQALHLAIGFPF